VQPFVSVRLSCTVCTPGGKLCEIGLFQLGVVVEVIVCVGLPSFQFTEYCEIIEDAFEGRLIKKTTVPVF
jgi:hypothetical protein